MSDIRENEVLLGASAKKKVCFCVSSFITGGVERVLVDYLNALSALDIYDLSVVFTGVVEDGFLLRQIAPEVTKVFIPPLNPHKPKTFFKRKWWKICRRVFSMYQRRLLIRVLADKDVVIDFKNGEVLSGYRYRCLPFQRQFLWFHGAVEDSLYIVGKKGIASYHLAICLSETFCRMYAQLGAPQPEKLRVLYNPVDLENIKRKQIDDTKLTKNERDLMARSYFLHVSRLDRGKDIDTLIKGYCLFKERSDDDVPALYIVGEGPDKVKYLSYVYEYGLQNDIFLLGEKENPYIWMKNAKALILSSLSEGFGCVLVEALACDTSVISSDCPDAPAEILENGRVGLLFEPGDAQDLAQKLALFCSGEYLPPTPEKIKASLQRFEKKKIVGQLIHMIDELVA